MPPAAAEAAVHTGQNGEAALLALVEGLVERVGGIRDPLHRRRRGGHGLGAVAQPRHRIAILLLRIA
jgi:hypothetical protein